MRRASEERPPIVQMLWKLEAQALFEDRKQSYKASVPWVFEDNRLRKFVEKTGLLPGAVPEAPMADYHTTLRYPSVMLHGQREQTFALCLVADFNL